MNESDHRLWPFKPRTSIYAAVAIFFGLLLLFVGLHVMIDWPSRSSESSVILGVWVVSLLPISLVLLDIVIQRGGVIEVRWLKLDFTHIRTIGTARNTVPVNVDMPDEPVGGSQMIDIKESLSQATTSEIAVIDLKEGDAWWDTRLLVLLAGAARLEKPKVVVFVGTENGMPQYFLGWGYADRLLQALIQIDPEYRQSLERARAEGRRWELVEPPLEESQDQEPSKPFPWMEGDEAEHETLADLNGVKAFENGFKNEFLIEEILANELQNSIEIVGSHREITFDLLEKWFVNKPSEPVLHQERIDQNWSNEYQIDCFFESTEEYLALTQRGKYQGMVSRLTVLNEFMRSMIEKASN